MGAFVYPAPFNVVSVHIVNDNGDQEYSLAKGNMSIINSKTCECTARLIKGPNTLKVFVGTENDPT